MESVNIFLAFQQMSLKNYVNLAGFPSELSAWKALCLQRAASAGPGSKENRAVSPASCPGQRNGRRALVLPGPYEVSSG